MLISCHSCAIFLQYAEATVEKVLFLKLVILPATLVSSCYPEEKPSFNVISF